MSTSPRRRSILWLLVLVAVSVLTRLVVWNSDIINVDEASYIVGAREILMGHLPYTTFGDNKPPLIYLYYALGQLLAGNGIIGVRLLTHLVTVPLTAFAVSAFYRHDRRGVTAALLFLLYSAAYTANDMLAVNCELIMLLPLAWALVALRTEADATRLERGFLAGFLIGVAALIKYQGAFWGPAVAIAVVVEGRRQGARLALNQLMALALGFALPLLATVTVFACAGGLEGLVYWNVTHNFEYLQNPVTMLDTVERAGRMVGPFMIGTAALWAGWMGASPLVSRYQRVLMVGLIATSTCAACLGFRFFPHYFVQLYVPLAIAAAPWISGVMVWPLRTRGWAVATATAITVVGWTTANAVRTQAVTVPGLSAGATHVADWLKTDACYAEASLFVWGSSPQFYYHADLPPASQYFFPEFPLVHFYAGNPTGTRAHTKRRRHARRTKHWRRLLADLDQSQPAYILDTTASGIGRWRDFPMDDYPALARLVRQKYTRVATVEGVHILRRNDCRSSNEVAGRQRRKSNQAPAR